MQPSPTEVSTCNRTHQGEGAKRAAPVPGRVRAQPVQASLGRLGPRAPSGAGSTWVSEAERRGKAAFVPTREVSARLINIIQDATDCAVAAEKYSF